MTRVNRIKPDLEFIKEIQKMGGENVKKCFQCGNCTVVCPLSPADKPFPQKEMIWAQWGLKDKLLKDMDIWLCHKCAKCTVTCPRGARPGELMAAMRNMVYRSLVGPSFLGRWMSSLKYLPKLISIPAIIYFLIWFITGSISGSAFPLKNGHVDYSILFPEDYAIYPIFGLVAIFVIWSFYKGIKKLKEGFDSQMETSVVENKGSNRTIWNFISEVIKDEVLTHKKFRACEEDVEHRRFKGHLMLFYGLLALFVVAIIVIISHFGGKIFPFLVMKSPMPIYNPVKLLGNIGAIFIIIGLLDLSKRRLSEFKKDRSTYYDWYLLGLLWVVTVTGILSEVLRLANIVGLAYPIYYVHLVTVFMFLAYLPWSKLGHFVYRIFALAYAKSVGRIPPVTKE